MTPACTGLVKRRWSGLGLLKSTSNAKNFICRQVVLVCLQPFQRNSLLKNSLFVAAQNRETFTKTPNFGGWMSFKIIDVDIPKKLVASACYDKQHVWARQANSGKITFFIGGPPLSLCRSRGPLSPSGMKCRHKILKLVRYHLLKPQSLIWCVYFCSFIATKMSKFTP